MMSSTVAIQSLSVCIVADLGDSKGIDNCLVDSIKIPSLLSLASNSPPGDAESEHMVGVVVGGGAAAWAIVAEGEDGKFVAGMTAGAATPAAKLTTKLSEEWVVELLFFLEQMRLLDLLSMMEDEQQRP